MENKTTVLTAQQYADAREISLAAVCETLRNHDAPSDALPGVVKSEKFQQSYRLEVDLSKVTKGRVKKYSKKVV